MSTAACTSAVPTYQCADIAEHMLQGPHAPAPLFEAPEEAVVSLAAKRSESVSEAARPEGLELPTAGADSLRQAPVRITAVLSSAA